MRGEDFTEQGDAAGSERFLLHTQGGCNRCWKWIMGRSYSQDIRGRVTLAVAVCAENLTPSIVVMQSTQDWTCSYEPDPLDRA